MTYVSELQQYIIEDRFDEIKYETFTLEAIARGVTWNQNYEPYKSLIVCNLEDETAYALCEFVVDHKEATRVVSMLKTSGERNSDIRVDAKVIPSTNTDLDKQYLRLFAESFHFHDYKWKK